MKISVRPLEADNLEDADRVMRLAFGTHNELDDPLSFMGDGSSVRPRWHADPHSAFAVFVDDRLVGSNFIAHWGSFAFFGPLSVDPAFWGEGLAHRLMAPVMERLDRLKVAYAGLFTYPHSLKHIGLYQQYGFRPRMLTAIFEKPIAASGVQPADWIGFSSLDSSGRQHALDACRRMTNAIYDGLDLTNEIVALERQQLGETVLLGDAKGELVGFAVCHCGAGSEGGSGNCYVKFAGVPPGPDARHRFGHLLNTIGDYAVKARASRLVAGVNAARCEAYEFMLSKGFSMWRTGIAMHRPNQGGFSCPGVYVIDDWR